MQGKCRAESSLYKCLAKSNNIPPKTYFGTQKAIGKDAATTTLNPLEI